MRFQLEIVSVPPFEEKTLRFKSPIRKNRIHVRDYREQDCTLDGCGCGMNPIPRFESAKALRLDKIVLPGRRNDVVIFISEYVAWLQQGTLTQAPANLVRHLLVSYACILTRDCDVIVVENCRQAHEMGFWIQKYARLHMGAFVDEFIDFQKSGSFFDEMLLLSRNLKACGTLPFYENIFAYNTYLDRNSPLYHSLYPSWKAYGKVTWQERMNIWSRNWVDEKRHKMYLTILRNGFRPPVQITDKRCVGCIHQNVECLIMDVLSTPFWNLLNGTKRTWPTIELHSEFKRQMEDDDMNDFDRVIWSIHVAFWSAYYQPAQQLEFKRWCGTIHQMNKVVGRNELRYIYEEFFFKEVNLIKSMIVLKNPRLKYLLGKVEEPSE
jgi:hypothetical protein